MEPESWHTPCDRGRGLVSGLAPGATNAPNCNGPGYHGSQTTMAPKPACESGLGVVYRRWALCQRKLQAQGGKWTTSSRSESVNSATSYHTPPFQEVA